ncbi:hypothetical protein [Polynucleobacter sphagniphilus]|uniref:hypothetical protein n=2 Tax=Polynucleobacter sphagniphilus TaxID=1743169 RepID=UPI00096B9C56|nr:hypothetical protein [Polynucleobacter sphagniphilus]MDF9787116.1 hypothetical protein [Polynucleobacter sphagniphilus]MDH6154467.1 hypothetical protein [Polynucleobacter sphagniphilus]OLY97495.1 hypothetical protein BOQ04_02175 [Polynucleobacter sphagniphilus]
MQMHQFKALLTVLMLSNFKLALAQDANTFFDTLTPGKERLISTERQLQAQDDVASVPIYINFDQKVGLGHQGSTQYTQIEPWLPYRINSDYSYVVHPQITYQSFNNFDGYSSSGFKPVIIESFFTESNETRLKNSFGFGPMVQIGTNMPAMYGSSQNAVGYSMGAIHRSEDWIVGAYAYQSFGLGAMPLNGPSANNVGFQPFITYITKRYGNITLDCESITNIDTGAHAYPINLMGSKLIEVGDLPLLFTIGARYYTVNTNQGGAQGWGGRIGLTYAFSH